MGIASGSMEPESSDKGVSVASNAGDGIKIERLCMGIASGSMEPESSDKGVSVASNAGDGIKIERLCMGIASGSMEPESSDKGVSVASNAGDGIHIVSGLVRAVLHRDQRLCSGGTMPWGKSRMTTSRKQPKEPG